MRFCLGSRRWQCRQCLNLCLSLRTQTKNNFQGFYLTHTMWACLFLFFSFFHFCIMLFHFHKVADDTQGREVLRELEADGVDTSFMAVIFSRFQSSHFFFFRNTVPGFAQFDFHMRLFEWRCSLLNMY